MSWNTPVHILNYRPQKKIEFRYFALLITYYKSLSSWAEDNNMTTVMSDIRCSEDDTSIQNCDANTKGRQCDIKFQDNNWLHCSSK